MWSRHPQPDTQPWRRHPDFAPRVGPDAVPRTIPTPAARLMKRSATAGSLPSKDTVEAFARAVLENLQRTDGMLGHISSTPTTPSLLKQLASGPRHAVSASTKTGAKLPIPMPQRGPSFMHSIHTGASPSASTLEAVAMQLPTELAYPSTNDNRWRLERHLRAYARSKERSDIRREELGGFTKSGQKVKQPPRLKLGSHPKYDAATDAARAERQAEHAATRVKRAEAEERLRARMARRLQAMQVRAEEAAAEAAEVAAYEQRLKQPAEAAAAQAARSEGEDAHKRWRRFGRGLQCIAAINRAEGVTGLATLLHLDRAFFDPLPKPPAISLGAAPSLGALPPRPHTGPPLRPESPTRAAFDHAAFKSRPATRGAGFHPGVSRRGSEPNLAGTLTSASSQSLATASPPPSKTATKRPVTAGTTPMTPSSSPHGMRRVIEGGVAPPPSRSSKPGSAPPHGQRSGVRTPTPTPETSLTGAALTDGHRLGVEGAPSTCGGRPASAAPAPDLKPLGEREDTTFLTQQQQGGGGVSAAATAPSSLLRLVNAPSAAGPLEAAPSAAQSISSSVALGRHGSEQLLHSTPLRPSSGSSSNLMPAMTPVRINRRWVHTAPARRQLMPDSLRTQYHPPPPFEPCLRPMTPEQSRRSSKAEPAVEEKVVIQPTVAQEPPSSPDIRPTETLDPAPASGPWDSSSPREQSFRSSRAGGSRNDSGVPGRRTLT